MPSRTVRRIAAASLAVASLVLPLAACGADREVPAGADTGAASPAASPDARADAPADAPTGRASLTAADLDLYERGLAHEITLVEAARARGDVATTPEERGAAMEAQYETTTMPAAAAHLGVDAARYEDVRTTVHEVLRTLDMTGAIEGPVSVDTTRVSDDVRARLADPYGGLPAATAEAIRARLDRLVPVYARYTRLVAVAG